ncbi:MAG: tetratricopeptide repeat protein, partial [Planctomycetota bacterium]
TNILSGRFEDALAALEKLDPAQIGRSEIRQELEFYKAYSKAKLALGGTGEITAAGSEMAGFINSYRNSFHWLEANQLVGDLLVANGAYDKAEAYYREVAQAPFPDAKMRAGVAMGRAMLAQGKTAEARTQYEQVLKEKAEGELAQSQQMSATLGIARCLVADGKAAEAVQMVQPVIDKAAPEETRLLAEAYNTLGTAQRAAGQNQEALMAFLHVDLLYFADPEAHAEALSNLVQLWRQLQKPEREMRARELLEQRYRNSVWAKKLG